MSSLVRVAVIVLLTATLLAGQRSRGGGIGAGGSRGGFSAGSFRGGVRGGPGFMPGGGVRYGVGPRAYPGMQGWRPGWHHGAFGPWYFRNRHAFGFRGYWGGYHPYGAYGYWPASYGYWPTVADPYAYPQYAYPQYSYPAYSDAYPTTPNVIVMYIPAALPGSPQVSSPERKEPAPPKAEPRNSNGGSGESGTAGLGNHTPKGTLLAFNSGAVYLTIAEWRSGESIHFVNRDGRQLAMPLETLDHALTQQLNRERNVEFHLNAVEGHSTGR